MSASYRYHATTRWTGARSGLLQAEGVQPPLPFSAPPEFQGEAGRWTPEHFFIAAVGACFVTTFRAISELSKFEFAALQVDVEGVLEKGEGGFRFTRVFVRPVLDLLHPEDHDRALRLLDKAERSCLVTRSLNSEVKLEPVVQVVAASRA
jgi:peroxiredoxin-like protein